MSALPTITTAIQLTALSALQALPTSVMPASITSTSIQVPAYYPAETTAPANLQTETRDKTALYTEVQQLLAKFGFRDQQISIGLAGYEGSQARCYMAEIGLAATAPGFYNLHLGGDPATSRLNKVYKIHLPEASLLAELQNLLAAYKITRKPGETFGEFVSRKKLV